VCLSSRNKMCVEPTADGTPMEGILHGDDAGRAEAVQEDSKINENFDITEFETRPFDDENGIEEEE
jgi:hypothetical protein